MKYGKVYYTLMDRALSRDIPSVFYEKHHVLPKSFEQGGETDKENIALLTLREHYLAHRLLAKMFCGNRKTKMLYALWSLSSTHKGRRMYNSRQYSVCRQAIIEARKTFRHTEESKQKMSFARKGKHIGAANPMYGRRGSLHPNYGKRSAFKGRKHTKESRQKMSINNIMRRDPMAGARVRWTQEARQQHSQNQRGRGNHNAKMWQLKNIHSNETLLVEDLKKFCLENRWNYQSLMTRTSKQLPYKGFILYKVAENV